MPVISGGGGGGGGSVNSVTAGDTSITIGGTGSDPTVETADLATIAADHATSGSVAMGSNKLTGLAAGTTAGDSVRYEQALLTGAVSAADTSIVVAGTGVAPTIRTATLDVIAADHPPAAAVAMNAQKITGLANGSAASDAAAFGQIIAPAKVYLNKPAGNITRASTSVGAFSTAWQITGVVVASGQNVYLKIKPYAAASVTTNDRLIALLRGATQIASWNLTNPGSGRPPDASFEWIDENPGAGTYTYEVQAAMFTGGTLTVYQQNPTTDVTGGSSIFIAEVYTP